MDSLEYQVTIKSANQKVEDYVTKCNSIWTVYRLKQHISETHVNKPKVDDQRLIYAGNILKNTDTLKQVFFRDSLCTELTNSNKADFTIHLVCHTHAPKSNTNSTGSNGSAETSSRVSASTSSSSTHPSTPAAATSNASFNSAAQVQASAIRVQPNSNDSARSPIQQAPVNNNNNIPTTPLLNNLNQLPLGNHSAAPTLTPAQQAEMVQNLMQSDQMRQQMAVFQQLAYVVAAQIASNVASNGNVANANVENLAQIQAPAPVAEQQAPQPEVQEGPMMQHDVIDWLYYSIRAAVLMAALYIHASVFRLLFIVSLMGIAYFFNRRRVLPTRQEPPPPPPQELPVAEPPREVQQQEDAQLRRRNVNRGDQVAADENNENAIRDQVQGEMAPNRVPFLKLCYLVVTDFLASLVPE